MYMVSLVPHRVLLADWLLTVKTAANDSVVGWRWTSSEPIILGSKLQPYGDSKPVSSHWGGWSGVMSWHAKGAGTRQLINRTQVR